ncbi:MAG: hypothetical protein K6G63_00510 [Eubacterium sp.]|nr:hypothetical protein [Eubacterium sp.]
MCSSNNVIKTDGFFVCQNCGTKYSVEEAKKLMIEGTVDVSGSTVKVDNTASIDNYYNMAESAYDSSNLKETESYCNKIIEIEPNDYRAWLLKGKAAGWQSTIARPRLDETVNCFKKAVDNSPEDEKERVKKESVKELNRVSYAFVSLACDNYSKNMSQHNAEELNDALRIVTNVDSKANKLIDKTDSSGLYAKIATKINSSVVVGYQNDILPDYWGSTRHPSQTAWENYKLKSMIAVETIQLAIDICKTDDKEDIPRYKNIIKILQDVEPSGSYHYTQAGWTKEYVNTPEFKQQLIDRMMTCHRKIKEIDPSYQIPQAPTPSKNGCYVATAVYGSYDCPQVWTLRRYRDYTLAETRYGRAFIHTYYAISPTLVKWFGHTDWFKKMWRGRLDSLVNRLNSEGVENTPYQDRQW